MLVSQTRSMSVVHGDVDKNFFSFNVWKFRIRYLIAMALGNIQNWKKIFVFEEKQILVAIYFLIGGAGEMQQLNYGPIIHSICHQQPQHTDPMINCQNKLNNFLHVRLTTEQQTNIYNLLYS